MSQFILDCSKQLDLVAFFGPGWKEEEDRDERSFSLKEIDFENVLFEHCLKEDETYITGEEKLNRLKEMDDITIRLGSNVFLALWEDYEERGDHSVLEWLRCERKITRIAFPGSPLHDPDGDRYLLYLDWDDFVSLWDYHLLDFDWTTGVLSALLPVEP